MFLLFQIQCLLNSMMVGLNLLENQISLGKNPEPSHSATDRFVICSGKGQSESVAKTDFDDTSVDFLYS